MSIDYGSVDAVWSGKGGQESPYRHDRPRINVGERKKLIGRQDMRPKLLKSWPGGSETRPFRATRKMRRANCLFRTRKAYARYEADVVTVLERGGIAD